MCSRWLIEAILPDIGCSDASPWVTCIMQCEAEKTYLYLPSYYRFPLGGFHSLGLSVWSVIEVFHIPMWWPSNYVVQLLLIAP